jgi:hypothetical protein
MNIVRNMTGFLFGVVAAVLVGLAVLASVKAHGAEPAAHPHADYSNPPRGSWGISFCGSRGVIWVQDHNSNWFRFSSEDGTGPDPDDIKGVEFFNDWLQSGPTDVVYLKNVTCK